MIEVNTDMRRRGFTLIELLVVIAIIAILAAILFPVFAKAREKARQSSCLSNCKQMVLGILSYAQDYDERFPTHCRAGLPAGVGDDYSWATQIMPYVKNDQLFLCPSASWNNRARLCGGYAYNLSSTAAGAQVGCDWASLGDFAYPSSTVIIGDSDGTKWFGMLNSDTAVQHVTSPGRHNDGANFAMVDGHCKWVKDTVYKQAGGSWNRTTQGW